MAPAVTIVNVAARPFAAVPVVTARAELGKTITACLDQVWASLRKHEIEGHGHNVVVYRAGPDRQSLAIEAGVEVSSPISADGDVVPALTPSGRAARAVHIGPYSRMADANNAILDYCRANGFPLAGVSWEIYGDWTEDETKLETEVFYLLR